MSTCENVSYVFGFESQEKYTVVLDGSSVDYHDVVLLLNSVKPLRLNKNTRDTLTGLGVVTASDGHPEGVVNPVMSPVVVTDDGRELLSRVVKDFNSPDRFAELVEVSEDLLPYTEWGISVERWGETRFIPFGSYDSAFSAAADWRKDLPDAVTKIASRTVVKSAWVVHESEFYDSSLNSQR